MTSARAERVETGQELAKSLGVPTRVQEGLEEHDRSGVPHMRSGEFISMMELMFRRPDELVLGNETADEAMERFEEAIDEVLARAPRERRRL